MSAVRIRISLRMTLYGFSAGPMDYTQGAMLNAGKVGDYVAVARRRGDTWYVGGLTDWEARSLELDLGFLGKGDWQVEIFTDGVNVSRNATDYKVSRFDAGNVLKVDMASGGGFAARITKRVKAMLGED